MNEENQQPEAEEQTVSVEFEEQDGEVKAEAQDSEETGTIVRDDSDDNSEELENYSENVQKRINQLTAKRKQAMEEAEAAYNYAEQMKAKNEEMRKRLEDLDKGYINEYGSRVETQGLRIQKARSEQQAQAQEQQSQQPQQPTQPQRPQELDPKLKDWMSRNPWFDNDDALTGAARAIHMRIVGEEGFDPSTDEYYAEIDKRMSPLLDRSQANKRVAQAVTPASNGRSATKKGGKTTVELTPGQVAFAKKMKIPLEQYAKEVARLEKQRSA